MKYKALFLALVVAVLASVSAPARTPTNNAGAFKTFSLYTDRSSLMNTSDHLNPGGYPASLASPPILMVMRPAPTSPDTMALFNSFAKDEIYFEVNPTHTQSFSTYTVSPPQYATSVGTLLAGILIFNGTGQFADLGKPLGRARVTYVDGDTAVVTLHVGYHIRDYFDSGFSCNLANIPFYEVRPTDPLSAYIYESGGYYLDAQESLLPKAKRAKRIASVRIEGVQLTHFCNVTNYSGALFSGLSIWPQFTVRNASNQPVALLRQDTGVLHGGYRSGVTVVGERRTGALTGCQVASMVMCYNYSGFPCTVAQLNAYLQDHKGYEPDNVALVTGVSPTGNTIRFTATNPKTRLRVGDLFVVDQAAYTNPKATYLVTVEYQASPFISGQATRDEVHNAGSPVAEHDQGRVYWSMINRVADMFTSPSFHIVELPDSPQLPAQVEDLLVQDIPVQLNVPGHMIVAEGWTSSFRPDGSARGTYVIRDPYEPRNCTKLIETRVQNNKLYDYNNFHLARYVAPGPPLPLVAGTTDGLGVVADGARRIEVVDPMGRRMLRDAATGESVSDIPDAAIEDVASEHDNTGDVDPALTGFLVHVPTAIDGQYTVRVYADDGYSLNVSTYNDAGVFASDVVTDTARVAVGRSYVVAYSSAGQSVTISGGGALGVEDASSGPRLLTVRHNPATGPVEFVLRGTESAGDAIEIFDIGGRRVDLLRLAHGATSAQTVSWNWKQAGCRPGIYLGRLRSAGNYMARVVVLP